MELELKSVANTEAKYMEEAKRQRARAAAVATSRAQLRQRVATELRIPVLEKNIQAAEKAASPEEVLALRVSKHAPAVAACAAACEFRAYYFCLCRFLKSWTSSPTSSVAPL